MNKVTLFLASSKELDDDRRFLKNEIASKNRIWQKTGCDVDLAIWEDMSARMSRTRSQDAYNAEVKKADVFVLLAWNKVGMYTAEEFEEAFGAFQATNKPFIFTFFKADPPAEEPSLEAFKNKLASLGHFVSTYTDRNDLWNQCNKELDRLLLAAFTENVFSKDDAAVVDYGDRKIKRLLGSVPMYPDLFIGRGGMVEQIYERLSGEDRCLLLVNGEGGIGKTTVAARYYHSCKNRYQHLMWLVAEKSIIDALLNLALELGVSFENLTTTEAKLDALIRVLCGLKAPSLMVIDNANSIDDLEAVNPYLRKCPQLHLLLTSRITHYGRMSPLAITHLQTADARELFVAHYPGHDASEDDLLQAVMAAVGYNTLVIELLAKSLATANNSLRKTTSLTMLLNDLQQKGVLGGTHGAKPVTTDWQHGHRLKSAPPEAVVAAMYDISTLPWPMRRWCCWSIWRCCRQ